MPLYVHLICSVLLVQRHDVRIASEMNDRRRSLQCEADRENLPPNGSTVRQSSFPSLSLSLVIVRCHDDTNSDAWRDETSLLRGVWVKTRPLVPYFLTENLSRVTKIRITDSTRPSKVAEPVTGRMLTRKQIFLSKKNTTLGEIRECVLYDPARGASARMAIEDFHKAFL